MTGSGKVKHGVCVCVCACKCVCVHLFVHVCNEESWVRLCSSCRRYTLSLEIVVHGTSHVEMNCVRRKKDLTTWQMAYYSNGVALIHYLHPASQPHPFFPTVFPLLSPSSTPALLCLALLSECLKTSSPMLGYNINSMHFPSLPPSLYL